MGYETKLIFTTGNTNGGYQSVVASVELSNVCYDSFGALVDKIRVENKKKEEIFKPILEKATEIHESVFTDRGDYQEGRNEENSKEDVAKYYVLKRRMDKVLPYIYETSGNSEDYMDSYGDLLLVASLKEVEEALIKDQAKYIVENGIPYRRYTVALKTIEGLKDFCYEGEEVRVVLFGH